MVITNTVNLGSSGINTTLSVAEIAVIHCDLYNLGGGCCWGGVGAGDGSGLLVCFEASPHVDLAVRMDWYLNRPFLV